MYAICTQVSQVEQLPRGELVTGTPIVLGEFSPNLPRGHNPAHTIDELKIIFETILAEDFKLEQAAAAGRVSTALASLKEVVDGPG